MPSRSAETPRDVARSRALNPHLQDFAQWLEDNAGRIPPEGQGRGPCTVFRTPVRTSRRHATTEAALWNWA